MQYIMSQLGIMNVRVILTDRRNMHEFYTIKNISTIKEIINIEQFCVDNCIHTLTVRDITNKKIKIKYVPKLQIIQICNLVKYELPIHFID